MNIPPSEAEALTLGQYDGLMHNWNKAHSSEDEPLEPPSLEFLAERQRRLEARGIKVLN